MTARNLRKYALLVLFVWLVLEPVAYVAGRILGGHRLFYTPDPVEGFDAYMADRDPILGWPGKRELGLPDRDADGSRLVPAFPDAAKPSGRGACRAPCP